MPLVRAGQEVRTLVSARFLWHHQTMRSIVVPKKDRGRPPVDSERVVVRLPRELLDAVDAKAKEDDINRPEAVRRLIAKAIE